MNKQTEENLQTFMQKFDQLNDEFYLAIQKKDGQEMDRIGRELTVLGHIIKDIGYKIGREVRS